MPEFTISEIEFAKADTSSSEDGDCVSESSSDTEFTECVGSALTLAVKDIRLFMSAVATASRRSLYTKAQARLVRGSGVSVQEIVVRFGDDMHGTAQQAHRDALALIRSRADDNASVRRNARTIIEATERVSQALRALDSDDASVMSNLPGQKYAAFGRFAEVDWPALATQAGRAAHFILAEL